MPSKATRRRPAQDYQHVLALDPHNAAGARWPWHRVMSHIDDSHRRQRAVPHSGRRRRHRDLSPQSAAALAEIDAENQYIVFTNRETGADLVPRSPEFRACAAARQRAVSVRREFLWEQLVLPFAVAQTSAECSVQSRIHRAAVLRLPDGHGVSRSAAQAASGIFSLVRSAVLEFLPVGVGAAVARIDRGVRGDARRSAALLRRHRAGDPSRRGARVLRNLAAPRAQAIICCAFPPRIRTRTWSGCCAYMRK